MRAVAVPERTVVDTGPSESLEALERRVRGLARKVSAQADDVKTKAEETRAR